jgi:hypothetical protein
MQIYLKFGNEFGVSGNASSKLGNPIRNGAQSWGSNSQSWKSAPRSWEKLNIAGSISNLIFVAVLRSFVGEDCQFCILRKFDFPTLHFAQIQPSISHLRKFNNGAPTGSNFFFPCAASLVRLWEAAHLSWGANNNIILN